MSRRSIRSQALAQLAGEATSLSAVEEPDPVLRDRAAGSSIVFTITSPSTSSLSLHLPLPQGSVCVPFSSYSLSIPFLPHAPQRIHAGTTHRAIASLCHESDAKKFNTKVALFYIRCTRLL